MILTHPLTDCRGAAEALALLAAHAVELRVSPWGGLLVRDPERFIDDEAREYLRGIAPAIIEELINTPEPVAAPLALDVPRCDQCKAIEFVDFPVHGGASVRRDCARCGRTQGFPVWHGVVDEEPNLATPAERTTPPGVLRPAARPPHPAKERGNGTHFISSRVA